MVVHSRDAGFAYTTVLAPRRLQKLACPTRSSGVVEHPVVRIVSHLLGMIGYIYVRLLIPLCAQVQKDVGLWQQDEDQELVVWPDEMPHSRQKHNCTCCHKAKKEDNDERVLVIHEVVAQAEATVGDAAIGESNIEPSKCRGDVNEEEAVEEADGCIPSLVRAGKLAGRIAGT